MAVEAVPSLTTPRRYCWARVFEQMRAGQDPTCPQNIERRLMGKRAHANPRMSEHGRRFARHGVIAADEMSRTPMLEMLLQLTPIESDSGLRVLEIGTDPQDGGSAVELADRAGGSVISISQSPMVVSRARAAHAADARLVFRRSSFVAGWPPGGSYDLVLSWQLMDRLPRTWVAQCAPGGRVLSLVFVSRSAATIGLGFVRVTIHHDRTPQTTVATPGNSATPDSMQWTVSPASLEPVDDVYNVICTPQADA